MKRPAFFTALAIAGLGCVPARAIVVASIADPNSANITGSNDFFQGFDLSGVAIVGSSHGGCSGSLLGDGISILTAAHCVSPGFGQPDYLNPTVVFMTPTNTGPGTGGVFLSVSQVFVNPAWTGSNETTGVDLAVLRLSQPGPAWAARYSLYTGMVTTNPVILAGFGLGGTGLTGGVGTQDGTFRAGTNEYAGDGTIVQWSSSMLVGQFYDVNNPSTNALGLLNPYTSSTEVDIAPGDSGGPSFYNGQIIGVHDVVACVVDPQNTSQCAVPPSITPAVGSFFGEIFADTSVAANATWIAAQEADIPEPASFALLLSGVTMMAAARRRRANRRA